MPISTDEAEKIARLAHLKFDPEELARFVPRFREILDYFTQLEQVSVDEVEPMYHALFGREPGTPQRKDEVRPSLPTGEALANAPDPADGHFRVPRVIE